MDRIARSSLAPGLGEHVGERQLLWIDLADRSTTCRPSGMPRAWSRPDRASGERATRADLTQYAEHLHLVLEAMEPPTDPERDGPTPIRRALDVVAGHDWVVSVHDGPLEALDRLDAVTEGETRFGAMDAAGLLAAIADEVIAATSASSKASSARSTSSTNALRRRPRNDILARIVELRRRIGTIRRTLAPHRVAFAALAPGDGAPRGAGKAVARSDRPVERAIDAVENLRDLLLSTFDIHGSCGTGGQRVMKVLTLLSAVAATVGRSRRRVWG
jgi:Mg2+ and Co2+ transporter CorA